mmetsp:Transcript_13832/g.42927  ORF Transcript_13832/g.42927 Transcript_13832/m.42927 type:complete len:133 (-) Transcript_13832:938-1336(-)
MRPPRETIQPRSALAKAMAGLTSRARGAAAGGAFVRARARGAGADREACCFARSSKSSSSSSSDEDEDDTSAAEAGAGAGAGASAPIAAIILATYLRGALRCVRCAARARELVEGSVCGPREGPQALQRCER